MALQSNEAFWKVSDFLFEKQPLLTQDNMHAEVMQFVSHLAIDHVLLDRCINRKLSAGGISQDVELGNKYGVRVTPTLFINGVKYDGAKDAAQLRALIGRVKGAEVIAPGSVSTGQVAVQTKGALSK